MTIPRRHPLTARVAVLSVGHHVYWAQFPGLLEELLAKTEIFKKKLAAHSVEIQDFGMSDHTASAYEVAPKIKAFDPDVLFIDMVTYATSATFAAVVRDLPCPVVLVALQPLGALDYVHGTTYMQLCNDDLCSIPEFCGVAIRLGKPVSDVILGKLEGDAEADAEIAEWCRIAHARHSLRTARLGLMGHALDTMLDMQTDPTAVTAAFGAHVVPCEPDEIMRHYAPLTADDPAVAAMRTRILDFFDTPDPGSDPVAMKLTEQDLATAARAAVALERFIEAKKLDGFAYYYEAEPGTEMRTLVTNFIVGNSLLTGAGFPMCGEFDVKTLIAMLLFDRLEIGGSFAEFHPMDFSDGTVLVGHDGPHHLNIADGKPVLRSLRKYHGKPGSGASVEFRIKTGPITMLSIGVNDKGGFRFVVTEGESVEGPIPPTGNTNTHGLFQPDLKTFLHRWCMAGPTHHFALGIGHHASAIEKLAKSFGVECIRI